ncbi:hypothetical protein [Acidiluteibacter ferrifornacis]|uniref:Sugar transporter n=1 Tax=Acidiluteibacter ferrifornacis TaxID=2692424 RepID=A0A6N9NIJ6_9FLAO|nr:hypothetical protein [Acidiluteibacter ferrifornacis]MBR9832711.1 hypothetical protein [bacterium]NBG65733.1 hypothetical protein [Acidiluteibacter ferrifornacis]
MTTLSKVPTWFWVVATIALIWNTLGVIAYLGQAFMPPEMLESLPEAERTLMDSTPAWVTAAFALAVWGGAAGSLLLLFRNSIAYLLLIISLVGIFAQFTWNLFIGETMKVYGPGSIIMPIMVLGIGIYLVFFARSAKAKGWLN